MKEKNIANGYIIGILKAFNGGIGKDIFKKKLPVKFLYALRRNLPEIEKAYKAYAESLNDICSKYGTTSENPRVDDAELQKKLSDEINELLSTETTIDVQIVSPEVLDICDGNENYDSLTYEEIDIVWWMLSED
ncbi:MAG: hypothetical protein LUG91_00105 [Ruminococcus sp.]|nr:hypothetical protein [Ruminococcus sp.]